ncbi:MAG: hypothetical protein ABSF70_03465 [Terracidiphilus sp.]|jgi:hypothetical protein
MRKFAAVLFFLLCSTISTYGQKTRYGQPPEEPKPAKTSKPVIAKPVIDYPIKVHISATHIVSDCTFAGLTYVCSLDADANLDGKKIELVGRAPNLQKNSMLIAPGDYSLRVTKDIHNQDNSLFFQEYDLLLPGGLVWHCSATGISE